MCIRRLRSRSPRHSHVCEPLSKRYSVGARAFLFSGVGCARCVPASAIAACRWAVALDAGVRAFGNPNAGRSAQRAAGNASLHISPASYRNAFRPSERRALLLAPAPLAGSISAALICRPSDARLAPHSASARRSWQTSPRRSWSLGAVRVSGRASVSRSAPSSCHRSSVGCPQRCAAPDAACPRTATLVCHALVGSWPAAQPIV